MLLHRRDMRGVVAHREDTAVHGRVQSLDAAVHHLGKAGEVGYIENIVPRLAQRLGGAAGRHQLDAVTDERGGTHGEPRLVAEGQEGAAEGKTVGSWGGPRS